MGELFEHIPTYNYYFEPGIDFFDGNSLLPDRWWALKNPVDLAQGNRARAHERRTPGLPCNLDDLDARLPDPAYVWLVRHPLDTACSLVPGLSNGWNHPPEPPMWEDLMVEQPIVRAAHMWEWVNGVGYPSLVERHPDTYVVRYEDLILDPRNTVSGLLAHLNAPDQDMVMSRYLPLLNLSTGGYEAKHQSRWVRSDHAAHIGRWKENLTDVQRAQVVPTVRVTAERFGYNEGLR